MCARFTLTAGVRAVAEALGVDPAALAGIAYRPRYNIAPTQPHFIVRERREEREALPASWGLVNTWATDAKRAGAQINARAEDVPRRRAYRAAWQKRRRCLVPADGFFEWTGPKTARRPVWFHLPGGGPGPAGRPVRIVAGGRRRLAAHVHDPDHRRQRHGRADPRPHAGRPEPGRRSGMGLPRQRAGGRVGAAAAGPGVAAGGAGGVAPGELGAQRRPPIA